jgi:hypothetical protein
VALAARVHRLARGDAQAAGRDGLTARPPLGALLRRSPMARPERM